MVSDTVSNEVIKDATVTLLTARDSMLSQFTYSDQNGSFYLSNLVPNNYRTYAKSKKILNLSRDILKRR